MGLYLVGENLDANRGYRRAETGELIQLMRGIYVDAGDDADDLVLRHAVRIARYLYPRAFLSAASAVLLAPTRDGRLYISGQRSQRTRLRGLEIVQNRAPARPSTIDAVVADGWGELPVPVSSLRQRFLEAFRLRSEHAQSMDLAMREALAARLVQEYGDAQRAADALWTLARDNEWYREGEGAERFLKQQSDGPMRNEAAFDLTVAWHGLALGDLAHDGTEWRWNASSAGPVLPPLIRQTTPGRLPPFIVSLLPEGWLESVLHDASDRDVLRRGKDHAADRIKEVVLWDLVSALGRVLRRKDVEEEARIRYDETPIHVYVEQIGARVRAEREVRFSSLFERETIRSKIVGLFLAVLELLRATAGISEKLLIECDSRYVIDSVTKWMPGWKRKGWRKSDGGPVLNRELLEGIDEAIRGRDVEFSWVKGHAGHPLNEAADERANAAAKAYQAKQEPRRFRQSASPRGRARHPPCAGGSCA